MVIFYLWLVEGVKDGYVRERQRLLQ